MFIDGWMDKDVVGYYSAIKKEYDAIHNDMEESKDCHIEWSRSDIRRQTSRNITYMWHLKKKELIYKTEVESQVQKKKNYGYQLGKECGRNELGDWNWHIHTAIYKTDN